jgi:two-component system response regulator AtoC
MSSILIIDDEVSICKTLALHLKSMGHTVEWVNTATDGLEKLSANHFSIVILDVHLPDMDGLSALQQIGNLGIDVHVIIITAFHDLELTVKAMQYGAVEFIHKPIDIEELDEALDMLIISADKKDNVDAFDLSDKDLAGTVVGCSRQMKDVFKMIGLVSQTKSTVLIEGESGTGKELVARAVHGNTPDMKGLFVPINCAAIVETLLESELFGHEKGAFTGAVTRKEGKFTQASGGTLFLDEIGDMSQDLQAKLLRVLQDHSYQRVGGKETLTFNGRIIAATNRNLSKEVERGNFREDLYYRLNVVKVRVPPLRERREDIPILANYLLNKINSKLDKNVNKIPSDVMAELVAFDWPGNVRQLENLLTRAVVMTRGQTLDLSLDKVTAFAGLQSQIAGDNMQVEPLRSIADMERDLIARTLEATKWHKGKACEILGVSRPRLERKIEAYNLTRD